MVKVKAFVVYHGKCKRLHVSSLLKKQNHTFKALPFHLVKRNPNQTKAPTKQTPKRKKKIIKKKIFTMGKNC